MGMIVVTNREENVEYGILAKSIIGLKGHPDYGCIVVFGGDVPNMHVSECIDTVAELYNSVTL